MENFIFLKYFMDFIILYLFMNVMSFLELIPKPLFNQKYW